MAAELRGQARAGEDESGQVEHAADLHDHAQDHEGQRRVRVGWIDELDEEGHEEEDRLRVHQADDERGAEGVRRAAHRRVVGLAVADLVRSLVPAPPGGERTAQQGEPHPGQVGGPRIFDDHEQLGRGAQH